MIGIMGSPPTNFLGVFGSDPTFGKSGQTYFNSGSSVMKIHNGTSWVNIGITNSATNNTIPKSDGTNLVSSGLTDTGSKLTYTTATEALSGGAFNFKFNGLNAGYSEGLVVESTSLSGYFPIHIKIKNAGYATSGILSVADSNGFYFGSSGTGLNYTYTFVQATSILTLLKAGYIDIQEITAPSNADANRVRIFAEDNGSGKTRLMAIFPSGAKQQIAIEP